MKNFKSSIIFIMLAISSLLFAQNTDWVKVTNEMRPGTRWWWLGSAVDKDNLTYLLQQYGKAGIGAVEITPIYGVQGNEQNDIDFLSPRWMEMLQTVETAGVANGIMTDMNTGTGWPFGGPEITLADAASKLVVEEYALKGGETLNAKIEATEKNQQNARLQRLMAYSGGKVLDITKFVDKDKTLRWTAPAGEWQLIAAFCGKTLQKVKRAAPGGDGYVLDHYSTSAVKKYLAKFDKAFASSKTPFPHNFFNDSYEVYGSDWTDDLFEQFAKRRCYKLENFLPEFLASERTETGRRLISDYRETISDLLLENFTQQWTAWAHAHGSKTRNQAHGSPGNLIDLYATVDIPECEGFGLSDFQIKGLRTDTIKRKNDSDLSMLKYASSAAHIAGKQYVSSETFTWLTEHFRTSLSQCKPELDLMFVAGVNHVYFHGTPYSPREAEFPGWRFYASINVSPTNTFWRDAPAMFDYITRCQSFLQSGMPDNDFLIYLPIYDVWHNQSGRFLQFSIHDMERRMPEFIHVVNSIYNNGYDVDYISDKFILSTRCVDKQLVTVSGAKYKALILPAVKRMPENVLQHIADLARQGATIVFTGNYPNDVHGNFNFAARQKNMQNILKTIAYETNFAKTAIHKLQKGQIITGNDYAKALEATGVQAEEMITKFGLHAIRRSNSDGYHYFVSGLQKNDVADWVTLAVQAKSVEIFDPMTGETGKAQTRRHDGKTQIYLQLRSGESLIIKTFSNVDIDLPEWKFYDKNDLQMAIYPSDWKLHFEESAPAITQKFDIKGFNSWTELPDKNLKILAGTGVYETTFDLPAMAQDADYVLRLGDVRESAKVFVNGKSVATVWAVPFECKIGKYLTAGANTLRIEVTNLNANRIADYDRRGVNWRIFKEINFVDLQYKNTKYGHWLPMESGLLDKPEILVYRKKLE
ncbi:MAG: glycosyl hydrolase family 2 [Paludibacter sp.]|jgi:hypothetical protein|nr:glycosyl hydrolase family 2 [Paludibacter sp.]